MHAVIVLLAAAEQPTFLRAVCRRRASPFSRAAAVEEKLGVDLFLCKTRLSNLRVISINGQKNKADVARTQRKNNGHFDGQRPAQIGRVPANTAVHRLAAAVLICDNLSGHNSKTLKTDTTRSSSIHPNFIYTRDKDKILHRVSYMLANVWLLCERVHQWSSNDIISLQVRV